MAINIVQDDSRLVLQSMDDEIYDCIITDPPYWTLEKWRNVGTTTRLGGHHDPNKRDKTKWFPIINYEEWWNAFCRIGDILKNNRHAYIFCDHEVMPIILNWARESDTPFNYAKPLVWDKINQGMGYHWRARHEYIVMLEKGKRRLNNLSLPDVFRCKMIQGKSKLWPTQKPLEVIEALLLNSTNEEELVLDPFCGAGTVPLACLKHGRNCDAYDIEKGAVLISRERLEENDE